MGEYSVNASALDGRGMRIGVVVARFNEVITAALLDGAQRELTRCGVADADLTIVWVPGAFELPLVATKLAVDGGCEAVICLGAIIRGETAHFDYVAMGATQGVLQASLTTGIPVVFGVLTVDNRQQADDRIGGKEGHKGEEAAATAIEMAMLLRRLAQ